MEEAKIIERLHSALNDFEQPVYITDGFYFNQYETLNQITLYSFSKFKTGDTDSQGNHKFFFNVVNPICRNATKQIDIDTKDIRIVDTNGNNRIKSLTYDNYLKDWMKLQGTGLLLNRLSDNLPRYGSVVWKFENGEIKRIKLENLIFDPAVNSIENVFDIRSSYVIEKKYLQTFELEKMIDAGWDAEAINDVLDEFRKRRENGKVGGEILIYEMHIELPNSYFIEGAKGYSYYRIFIAGNDAKKDFSLSKERILFYNKENKMPYKKVDYVTIDGRALGLGEVESQFDTQIRMNVMKNEKASSMLLGSKTIFTTADDTIERNIIQQTLNGDIMKVKSGLVPVVTDTRNLSAYAQEESSWMAQSRQISNNFESITGEQVATNTPWKSYNKMNQEGAKFFSGVKENMALFIRECFKEWLIPKFEKYIKDHSGRLFEIIDPNLITIIQNKLIEDKIGDYLSDTVFNTGFFPSTQDIDNMRNLLKAKQGRSVTVKIEEDLANFDKDIDIDITGEAIRDNLDNKMLLVQMLSQNAQALQDPVVKRLVDSAMEDMGLSLNIFNPYATTPQQQNGGNVASQQVNLKELTK